jgi:hypothetical protein
MVPTTFGDEALRENAEMRIAAAAEIARSR